MAEKLQLGVIVRAIDQATAPLRRIGAAIHRVGRQTGLDRLAGSLGAVGRGFGRVGREAGRFARRVGLLAAASAAAGIGLASRFAAAGDNIAKTADRLGFGVVALQRYRYAAERAGVEQRTFDMGMQRFGRRRNRRGEGRVAISRHPAPRQQRQNAAHGRVARRRCRRPGQDRGPAPAEPDRVQAVRF